MTEVQKHAVCVCLHEGLVFFILSNYNFIFRTRRFVVTFFLPGENDVWLHMCDVYTFFTVNFPEELLLELPDLDEWVSHRKETLGDHRVEHGGLEIALPKQHADYFVFSVKDRFSKQKDLFAIFNALSQRVDDTLLCLLCLNPGMRVQVWHCSKNIFWFFLRVIYMIYISRWKREHHPIIIKPIPLYLNVKLVNLHDVTEVLPLWYHEVVEYLGQATHLLYCFFILIL